MKQGRLAKNPCEAVTQELPRVRKPELQVLDGSVHVPVAEGLTEQLVDGSFRFRPSVVRGERLGLVEGGDLQVPSGLQVDVPELDAAPSRLGATLPAGAHRTDEVVGIEQQSPQGLELRRVLGRRAARRAHRNAARTTSRRRIPRATGITRRRWRGFMPPC